MTPTDQLRSRCGQLTATLSEIEAEAGRVQGTTGMSSEDLLSPALRAELLAALASFAERMGLEL